MDWKPGFLTRKVKAGQLIEIFFLLAIHLIIDWYRWENRAAVLLFSMLWCGGGGQLEYGLCNLYRFQPLCFSQVAVGIFLYNKCSLHSQHRVKDQLIPYNSTQAVLMFSLVIHCTDMDRLSEFI